MTRNVGGIDRVLRIVIGLALVVAAATGTLGVWAWSSAAPGHGPDGLVPALRAAGHQHLPDQAGGMSAGPGGFLPGVLS